MFNSDNIQAQNNNTPIKAGPSVPVTLVSVTKGDKGELKFNFKGTSSTNSGVFTHTEFAIDPSDERWTQVNQDRVMARILHIGARFADEAVARAAFKGDNWDKYADNVIKFFSPAVIKNAGALNAKITIREAVGNDGKPKVYNQFPMFPNFLSSEKFPTAFSTSVGYDKYSVETVTDTPTDMNKASGGDDLPF